MAQSDAAKYVAEFIGTYLLVLTVGCNVLSDSGVFAVLSIASVLMVSIYALGSVSGAHFNPAVTTAIALSGKMTGGWTEAFVYMIVQIIAGVAAGFTNFALFGKTFNLEPADGFTWKGAAFVEILYTAMLCFTVLNVACTKSREGNQFYGLAIGFVIVAGGYAGGPISGGAFNPAVAFGIDIPSAGLGFGWSFAYLACELVGAALATMAYKVIRADEKSQLSKLFSEFLGTFYLVTTVGLIVLSGSKAGAFAIAASLMVMIYALGDVSGAHFNPAVTFSILISGRQKITVSDACQYVVAQIFGGLCGGFAYSVCRGKSFGLGPGASHGMMEAFVVEAIFTFVLCFVVLTVATTKASASSDMFGLAIGACVTVGGFASGKISGGSLNPGVSVGIDASNAVTGGGHFMNSLVYTGAELVGGALAACTLMVTHPSEYVKCGRQRQQSLISSSEGARKVDYGSVSV